MADEIKEETGMKEVTESKAKRLAQYFETNRPNTFSADETNDELHTTIFRSNLVIENQQLPIGIFVDDSIYLVVRVQVATGVIRKNNEAQIIEHLNELNRSFKVFKYFVDQDGAIFLDSCIPTADAYFDPQMVDVLIDVILQHLTDKYAELMKKVWA